MTVNDNNTPTQENESRPNRNQQVWFDGPMEKDAELLQPPEAVYRVAGFWIRLSAFTIDMIVIAALNSVIWNILLVNTPAAGFLYQVWHVNSLFLGITGVLYFIIMTHCFQQTLGKMILGIRVVQRSGKPLSWLTVIFRELVARSLSQLMGLNLGYIVCWFNKEKRCIQDYLSDTWVVYEKADSANRWIKISG
jgi:uncharacterized RDD family membrane protein YckC